MVVAVVVEEELFERYLHQESEVGIADMTERVGWRRFSFQESLERCLHLSELAPRFEESAVDSLVGLPMTADGMEIRKIAVLAAE